MTTTFIISAPSGSGKSTLVKHLRANVSNLIFSVSWTTRTRQGRDEEGDYCFVSREEFQQGVARDEFLEWAQVFENYYGTRRDYLDRARAEGKDLVLDIDVQGARQLTEKIPEAVTIFILPPSKQVLEQRLRDRGDTPEQISRRLKGACKEILNYEAYDYVLINREREEAAATLCAIVRAERVRRTRIEDQIQPILETFKV
jgi:guanylate kinase